MAGVKRIMISIPQDLLQEIDDIVDNDKISRSQFIRDAMQFYIGERKRKTFREMMKKGYKEMAVINRALAEEGLLVDIHSVRFSAIQETLVESE